MNKKGADDLVNNMLGVILALAATLPVVFIYISITQMRSDSELESAQALADMMKERIGLIDFGESNNLTFQGSKELEGWFVVGWSKHDASKPDKCFFSKGCICICDGTTSGDCQSRGICREFETEKINITYYYRKFTENNPGTEPIIYAAEEDAIPIPSNLLVLEISKKSDELVVSHYTSEYLRQFGR